jgi:DNA-binding transcriptional regulator of glucitol operon
MKRRDDTPEIVLLAVMLCIALALGGWVWEVLHG